MTGFTADINRLGDARTVNTGRLYYLDPEQRARPEEVIDARVALA